MSFGAVHLAIHPCSKLQGIQAKANKRNPMYLSYYNLESKPFQMSTDPDFLWLGEKHKEALATLKYAIVENKGILAMTGDVGTGKTTLINALIQSLGDDTLAATIYDPSLGVLEFFNIISFAFNMGRTFHGKGEFLIYFKQFLKEVRAQNKKVLLIIDEAQRISNELLEEVRLLSNLEDEYIRLLNIFFVGQNEFIDILKEYKNRALRQRITLSYHIEPLTLSETEVYIRHRLKISGAKAHIFTSDAVQEIFSFSNGYPRLINIICDHALLSGYVREILIITADIIKECKEELQISNLNMGQDTYISDDESETIRKGSVIRQGDDESVDETESPPKIPVIQRAESARHKKKLSSSAMVTRIILLVTVGLVAGYVFYSPVKTRTTPSSSQALMQDRTTVSGQTEEKSDLRTTVSPVLENNAYSAPPDRVEPAKMEASRYDIVKSSEYKPIREIDTDKDKIPTSMPSVGYANPWDMPTTSGGLKKPEALDTAPNIEPEKPKTTSIETKPVAVEKKTLDKDRAKLDDLGNKELSPQKDRTIDDTKKTVAPKPSKKPVPPVMAKSFNTVQEPAAAVVSEKDITPPKTPAISEGPPAGFAVAARVPEDLQSRLNAFLSRYCQTYEKEQLSQFATFFTPDAMEKGKSFTSRLDQYRRTFERVDSMNYRIELKRYAIQKGTGAIRIEGLFHARARLVENKKWLENSGPIAMELVAHGDSFQVRRLEY
jgi:general secretion pathway protein A